jgi:hypothetical protein
MNFLGMIAAITINEACSHIPVLPCTGVGMIKSVRVLIGGREEAEL